jgi:hypothetical protein
MARVKKQGGMTEELMNRPLSEFSVSKEYECAECGGDLVDTPSGFVCAVHGGGPPHRAKGSAREPDPMSVATPTTVDTPSVTSAKLVEELEKADKEAATAKARSVVFGSANAAVEKPIDPRYPIVVERTFAPRDWNELFDRIDAWLELGDKRSEKAFVRKGLEQGPALVRDAFGAYLQIKQVREDWELRNDVVLGCMREQANEVLQAEKNRGVRSKAITEADVDKKVAQMFPDEHAEQESKRRKYKLVEDRAKHYVEVATLRCRVLDTLLKSGE